jgi:ADP-ribose pyrophosphatase
MRRGEYMKKWIINSKRELLNRRIFTLEELECYHPEKKITHNFAIINTADWINIVPLTDDNRFILIRQHRLGTDEITVETPAGLIEGDEQPEPAAQRELLEETGYAPKKMILLKKLTANPSIMNNSIYFFLARGCRKVAEQNLDSAENIEIQLHPLSDVLRMIKENVLNHSIIITALSLYFMSPYCDEEINYY